MNREISRRQCLKLGLTVLAGISGCNPEAVKKIQSGNTNTPDRLESEITPFGKLRSQDCASLASSDPFQKNYFVELNSLMVRTAPWEGLLVKPKNKDESPEQALASCDGWWKTSLSQQVKNPLDCTRKGFAWGIGLREAKNGEGARLIAAIYVTDSLIQKRGGPEIQTWVSEDGINWQDLGISFDFNINNYGGWTQEAEECFFVRFL